MVAKNVIFIMCFLSSSQAHKEDSFPSWEVAKQVIRSCYSGWDLDITLQGGYEQHEHYLKSNPFIKATLTIPIYSRHERVQRYSDLNKQLEHLSDLYADYEESLTTIKTLKEQTKALKEILFTKGSDGIDLYFKLIKDIEKERAKRRNSIRKIKSMLETCKYLKKS